MTSAEQMHDNGKGSVRIRSFHPKVSLFVVSGMLDEVLARAITEEGSRISRDGGARALHDWSGLRGYSSEARRLCTDWMMANRHNFQQVTILVSSSLVAMGVNVANIALGGFIRAMTDADAFAVLVAEHERHPGG